MRVVDWILDRIAKPMVEKIVVSASVAIVSSSGWLNIDWLARRTRIHPQIFEDWMLVAVLVTVLTGGIASHLLIKGRWMYKGVFLVGGIVFLIAVVGTAAIPTSRDYLFNSVIDELIGVIHLIMYFAPFGLFLAALIHLLLHWHNRQGASGRRRRQTRRKR